MEFEFKSIITKKLSKDIIAKICKLKNLYWNYSLESQYFFFKKNVASNDIHNCLFYKKILIGYTMLRKRTVILNKKKNKYLLFDTLIIHPKFRNNKFSTFLMIINNYIIKKKKMASFLLCKKKMIKFYSKFCWTVINSKHFFIEDKKTAKHVLSFNFINSFFLKKNKIRMFTNS